MSVRFFSFVLLFFIPFLLVFIIIYLFSGEVQFCFGMWNNKFASMKKDMKKYLFSQPQSIYDKSSYTSFATRNIIRSRTTLPRRNNLTQNYENLIKSIITYTINIFGSCFYLYLQVRLFNLASLYNVVVCELGSPYLRYRFMYR